LQYHAATVDYYKRRERDKDKAIYSDDAIELKIDRCAAGRRNEKQSSPVSGKLEWNEKPLTPEQEHEGTDSSNARQEKKATKTGLKDGDVLLMRKYNSPMQRVISAVTGSPYTHAAVYSDGNVYDSLQITNRAKKRGDKKDRGGNINTFDEFVDRDRGITYDVFRAKEKQAAREAAKNIERITKSTVGYSNSNAVPTIPPAFQFINPPNNEVGAMATGNLYLYV